VKKKTFGRGGSHFGANGAAGRNCSAIALLHRSEIAPIVLKGDVRL